MVKWERENNLYRKYILIKDRHSFLNEFTSGCALISGLQLSPDDSELRTSIVNSAIKDNLKYSLY